MMKLKLTLTALAVGLCSVLISSSQEEAEDNLATLLKSNGWDVLIGTWLNPSGEEFIFSWQYPGTALEMVAEVNGVKRSSIYVKQAKSATVNVFAYDSSGGSSYGTCTFSKGIAEFVMKTNAPGTNELREMKFKYTLTNDDAFEATMEGHDHVYKYTKK